MFPALGTQYLPPQIIIPILLVIAGWIIQSYFKYQELVKNFHPLPGWTALLDSGHPLSDAIPRIPGITFGSGWYLKYRYDRFAQVGYDAFPAYSFFPRIGARFMVADAAAIKEVTIAHHKFPKPTKDYERLNLFGTNVISVENQDWKKHRRVTAPAFSERTNKLVWEETVLVARGLFELWGNINELVIDHVTDVTMAITLMVISVAGFGKRLTWDDDVQIPDGHSMTFKTALHVVSTRLITKIIVPEWAMWLTSDWRMVRDAFSELKVYMREMIKARRITTYIEAPGNDLLSSLLQASDMGGEGEGLTDEELTGNIFIFLIAGHETTSHTLSFTLAFLALYPDIQEKLFQHVKENVTDISNPSYSEMASLTYATAVIYETLRHMAPVPAIPKTAGEDTIMYIKKADGSTETVKIPKGTPFTLSVAGLHFNPRYWDNPKTFDPSRFLRDWPKDAFLPFSAGPRACIGRRFAETESVAILSMMVSHFEICVKPEPQFASETFEQRKDRVLNNVPGITTTPVRVPLVFKRRGER